MSYIHYISNYTYKIKSYDKICPWRDTALSKHPSATCWALSQWQVTQGVRSNHRRNQKSKQPHPLLTPDSHTVRKHSAASSLPRSRASCSMGQEHGCSGPDNQGLCLPLLSPPVCPRADSVSSRSLCFFVHKTGMSPSLRDIVRIRVRVHTKHSQQSWLYWRIVDSPVIINIGIIFGTAFVTGLDGWDRTCKFPCNQSNIRVFPACKRPLSITWISIQCWWECEMVQTSGTSWGGI